jgi:hypothetical protein
MSDLSPKPLDAGTAAGLTLPGQAPAQQQDNTQNNGNAWQAPATGLPF